MYNDEKRTENRNEEITKQYLSILDQHLKDIVEGEVSEMMEIQEIAGKLFISHSHLTDTIKQTLGQHPCHFYDLKIIDQAKDMLVNSQYSVAEIARKLTYDPSNFSKFFKKMTAQTPGKFRETNKK